MQPLNPDIKFSFNDKIDGLLLGDAIDSSFKIVSVIKVELIVM